jgi:predicted lipoprotein with Yx(FWY)xxD motif
MKLRLTLVPAAAVAAALLLSACASTEIPGSAVVSPTAASTTASGSTPAAAAPTIALGDAGEFGKVLTGDKGLTLYGFTDDKDGLPTCVGACATAWPAVIVNGAFTAPAGFDASLFTVVDRPDGGKQLKFGKWPLYFYSGDEKAGDINGQGSGNKWFVLDGKGALLKEAPAAATTAPAGPSVNAAEVGSFGKVLVAANGLTLYGFTDDTNGTPTCTSDACKKTWPALAADAGTVTGAGLDQAQLTTVDRPDGGKQLKYGKWPLYFYSGDGKAGEANGQGIGTKWFVIATDGKLVKPGEATATATPAPTGPVVSLANVGKLGQVMVGANGHTLYAFTTDTKTKSTCVDQACVTTWPPLTVQPGFQVSADLAKNGVTTLTRPDGSLQLVMGDWPLYFYSGDAKAGEANGQGAGGKWFAINAQCKLVKTAA